MNKLILSSENRLESILSIPKDILDLIWFENGPLKNYELSSDDIKKMRTKYAMWGKSFGCGEPSAIDVELSLCSCNINKALEKPDAQYFPVYRELDSEQRYLYLKWLASDFSIPVDIGYVFLYYYGLERHLVLGKRQEALCMIIKLWLKYRDNKSFDDYVCNTIMHILIQHSDINTIEKIIKLLESEDYIYGKIITNYKVMLFSKVDVIDILRYKNSLTPATRRLINNNEDNWIYKLKKYMTREYRQLSIPVPSDLITESPTCYVKVFANWSLREFVKHHTVYAINRNSRIMRLISENIKNAIKDCDC